MYDMRYTVFVCLFLLLLSLPCGAFARDLESQRAQAARVNAILDSAVVSPVQAFEGARRFHLKRQSVARMPFGTSTFYDEIFVDGSNQRITFRSAGETRHLVANRDGIFVITNEGIEEISPFSDPEDLELFTLLYRFLDISLDPSLNYISPQVRDQLYTFEFLGSTHINAIEADIIRVVPRDRRLTTYASVVYVSRPTRIVVRREVPGRRYVARVLYAQRIRGMVVPTVVEIYTGPNMRTVRTYTANANPRFP
ncbi:MAG: hypothetical protein FWC85_02785, partial [Elusimicrobia bacterium]|nr:hypothetical protein [Elusimicrobiota bacterium]